MSPHNPPSATADLLQAGIAAHQAGRLAAAEEVYRRILDAEPAHPDALHMLGLIALQSDQPALAVELIEAANDGRPGDAVILSNLAEAFQQLGCFEDARRCGEQALARDPASAAAHVNFGNALKMLGQYDRAEACFRRAVELDPAAGLPRLNLALLRLMRGAYDEGLALYECRLDDANLPSTGDTRRLLKLFAEHAIPGWQGEPLHGRSLLVWTEQGLGDSLMTMRYLPQLKQSGCARLAVCCEEPLARIMRAVPQVDAVFSDTGFIAAEPRFDLQCPMMSLPLRMATRLQTIPLEIPYIRVIDELQQQWLARVAALPGLRVGVVWAGGRKSSADPRRSVTLAAFAPVLATPGCTFVSLQKGDATAQLQPDTHGILDFMDLCGDLMDTAALVANLELVISVDTSIAHLAGALGKPVWLLNRMGSEWRWLLDRADSPWYPTMRIFRQASGDWSAVMRDVAAALKATVHARNAADGEWRGRLRQLWPLSRQKRQN